MKKIIDKFYDGGGDKMSEDPRVSKEVIRKWVDFGNIRPRSFIQDEQYQNLMDMRDNILKKIQENDKDIKDHDFKRKCLNDSRKHFEKTLKEVEAEIEMRR